MADNTMKSLNVSTSIFDKVTDSDGKDQSVWAGTDPALDLSKGGQWGFLPQIGSNLDGKATHAWMYNQAYVRRDLIPIVLQVPRVFDLLPNAQYWKAAAKALFEVHARTIEGLNASLTVETAERELGLEGAKQKEPVNVTREETNVTITADEKYGVPIEILIDIAIRYGQMDPDTKYPLITTLKGAEGIDVYTPEWYTWTVLFIEPDVLLRRPIHAWLVSNLFPTSNPEIIGKKDKKESKTMKEMNIEFGGIALPPTNKNVMSLAGTILDSLKLYTKTPDEILLPADKISSALSNLEDTVYYNDTKPQSTTNA